ncbi:hypothetical protein [Nocardia sp. NBC_01329]|uniref:hypothetical protein n=1 Tax=Nocardia sp. NBC_01329 TaxID=2903594 RepID=UPI002E129124|nr:hypothetical protein OG405_02680 [Nocardia sp. NBC_01329]
MRARRSTLILACGWVATFVLYLFVKPDQIAAPRPEPAPTVPAVHQVPVPVVPAR